MSEYSKSRKVIDKRTSEILSDSELGDLMFNYMEIARTCDGPVRWSHKGYTYDSYPDGTVKEISDEQYIREPAPIKFVCPGGGTQEFTPWMGTDPCFVAGIGPTNSGKTYLRKFLAAHYTQSGVLCRSIGERVYMTKDKDLRSNILDDFMKTVVSGNTNAIKYFDIDELHGFIVKKDIQKFIGIALRTWRPYGAGLGLWGQDAYTFKTALGGLPSMFTTIFFFANPYAGERDKEIFNITDNEVELIQRLKPRKEALFIQRGKGISSTIVVP